LLHASARNVPQDYGITFNNVSERHIRVRMVSPYAAEALFGYFWTVTNRFKPPHNIFVVRQIAREPSDDPSITVFDIKWGTFLHDMEKPTAHSFVSRRDLKKDNT